jgi:outer membrane protein insertion porin family
VLGDNGLYSAKLSLTRDTRDSSFLPTEGHRIELAYEQNFGDFDFPRFTAEASKYYMLSERPDGSGRHVLSLRGRFGISGSQTPVFENFFAGGFSTLRGFDFRGASPVQNGVIVGGELMALGSVEYMVPLTADDMLRGVVFCDFGTVEQNIALNGDNFRVAPGVGLRINVPAMGSKRIDDYPGPGVAYYSVLEEGGQRGFHRRWLQFMRSEDYPAARSPEEQNAGAGVAGANGDG